MYLQRLFRRFALRAGMVAVAVLLPTFASAPAKYPLVRLHGRAYVDAQEFARRFGLACHWIVANDTLRLQSKWTRLELSKNALAATLNGLTLYFAEPIVAHGASLYLSAGDADALLGSILAPRAERVAPRLRTIVIDPGHGGNDPGNMNRRLGLREKTYTLAVAKVLQQLLTAQGYRVILTRRDDRRVELDDRTEMARRAHADLFVSIHFNSFSDPKISGAETFIMTPVGQRSSPGRERDEAMPHTRFTGNRHDHWNAVLGYHVQRELTRELQTEDRGLKRFRYHVLRNAPCPAVLVEAAFLSNDREGSRVATAAYRRRIAEGVAAGITAYAATLKPAVR